MTNHRPLILFPLAVLLASCALAACSRKDVPNDPTPGASSAPRGTGAEVGIAGPADGKYERVTVEGVTVPMINVMNNGTIVLIDTDGTKPRTWEEQYKRKGDVPEGMFNIHKTNVNKNDTFEDDPIDREGMWAIDAKGNMTKR
jgi:hypothetical protein